MNIYYRLVNNLLQFLNLNCNYSISTLQAYENIWNSEIEELRDDSELKHYLKFNSSLNLWIHTINNIILLYSTIQDLLPCASLKKTQLNITKTFSLYHGIRYKNSTFRDTVLDGRFWIED